MEKLLKFLAPEVRRLNKEFRTQTGTQYFEDDALLTGCDVIQVLKQLLPLAHITLEEENGKNL